MWGKGVIALLLFLLLLEEFHAQRNRTRGANRRNRGNRGRGGGGRNRGQGGGRARGRRCEAIQVPMCKGMVGYPRTKLPNRFNHTTQLQVYRVLEHLWGHLDSGCSDNLRLLACSLYLPRCAGRRPALEPCRKTCKQTRRVATPCLEGLGYSWPSQIPDCMSLPKKRCVRPGEHNPCTVEHTMCQPITLPMCQGLRYAEGMVPNMFGQCNVTQIGMEMEQFRPLLESGCSDKLSFFMCSVYMPFCTEAGMAFPCRELCLEVRADCEAEYSRLSRGMPWPNKFQCHRYPPASDTNFTCVVPRQDPDLSLT